REPWPHDRGSGAMDDRSAPAPRGGRTSPHGPAADSPEFVSRRGAVAGGVTPFMTYTDDTSEIRPIFSIVRRSGLAPRVKSTSRGGGMRQVVHFDVHECVRPDVRSRLQPEPSSSLSVKRGQAPFL